MTITTRIRDLGITGTYFLRISSCISVGEGPVDFAPEKQNVNISILLQSEKLCDKNTETVFCFHAHGGRVFLFCLFLF